MEFKFIFVCLLLYCLLWLLELDSWQIIWDYYSLFLEGWISVTKISHCCTNLRVFN